MTCSTSLETTRYLITRALPATAVLIVMVIVIFIVWHDVIIITCTCWCNPKGDKGQCISGRFPYRSMMEAYRTYCFGKTTVPELLSGLVDHLFSHSPACHLPCTSHIKEAKVFWRIVEDFISKLRPGS